MNLFWQEFTLFIVSVFALLVGVSAGWLFLVTARYEKQLNTFWRSLGFFSLGIAFFFFIIERKFEIFGLFGTVLTFFGFVSIYRGVLAEPKLVHLSKGVHIMKHKKKEESTMKKIKSFWRKFRFLRSREFLFTVIFLVLLAVLIYILQPYAGGYVMSALELFSIVFIALIMTLQIVRYVRGEARYGGKLKQNLWPLFGFIAFLLRSVVLFFYRYPETDIVFLRKLTLDYGPAWQLSIVFTFLAFIFVALWIWHYIKVRIALRVYIVVLAIALLVSTIGSLVFLTKVFTIVENNNLDLMREGARTQNLILENHSDMAVFVAKTMSNDLNLLGKFKEKDTEQLYEITENYLLGSEADFMRLYDNNGKVVVSPSDLRDEGRVFISDPLVSSALDSNLVAKSYDLEFGVLSKVLVTRAVYPVSVDENVIGAIEVGYRFDNAFVDLTKRVTGIDATVYAGKIRSATTITTLDGASRWIGSLETNDNVIQKVLNNGLTFSTQVERLGQLYYSAYTPIKGYSGEIIGMVSVGVPTSVLFEGVRQELITTLLIVTALSVVLALSANLTIFSVFQERIVKEK